jgi:apolipoprotein N-acyltransferase
LKKSKKVLPVRSDEKFSGRFLLFLTLLTGVGLGISFPPFQLGILACFALIPLLLVFEYTDGFARPLRYTYVAFLVLQIVSVYWMGGFVHGRHGMQMFGGALLLIAHPFFFFIPVLGYLIIRRTFGLAYALISLPFIWVGFEYIHSIGDLAFPWQTLGNTQSYDIIRAQFISFTGVYGLSFWIICINALGFYLLVNIATERWNMSSKQAIGTALIIVVIHFIPFIYGKAVFAKEREYTDAIRVGLVQPDSDPFEKWDLSRHMLIGQLVYQSELLVSYAPDIIIWPENAVTFYLMMPQSGIYRERLQEFIDDTDIPVLTGLPYARFYSPDEQAPRTAKEIPETGDRYESFNAAVLIEPYTDDYQFYGKIVLVPFVEKIPFGDVFEFAVKIRRSIGIGGWDVGPDTTLFSFYDNSDNLRTFGAVICYESVYPGFVRHFTRRGADFLVVITNDSWWGRTPGPRQHLQMSVFRAIENRRAIARSANGGISAFLDPYGRITTETELFTQTQVVQSIPISGYMTFYARHGDVFSKLCLLLGVLPVVGSIGERMRKRIFATQDKYRKETDENDRSKK